jgi:hypothetical protein
MKFLLRIALYGLVSMATFNTAAFYLNTNSLKIDMETTFTVVGLRNNMEDIGSWCSRRSNEVFDWIEDAVDHLEQP